MQVCTLCRYVHCAGMYIVQVCTLCRYVHCAGMYIVQVCTLCRYVHCLYQNPCVFNFNFVNRRKRFVKVLQVVVLVKQASVNKRLAAHLRYYLCLNSVMILTLTVILFVRTGA